MSRNFKDCGAMNRPSSAVSNVKHHGCTELQAALVLHEPATPKPTWLQQQAGNTPGNRQYAHELAGSVGNSPPLTQCRVGCLSLMGLW
jgi:hypothetical protein